MLDANFQVTHSTKTGDRPYGVAFDRSGDRIFFYHTGTVKAVVGVAKAASAPYPDPADKTGKFYAIDIVPVHPLKSPVTLAAVKADKAFASFALVRISRLSVMPVTDDEWKRIETMAV